jgi:ribosomal protein L22
MSTSEPDQTPARDEAAEAAVTPESVETPESAQSPESAARPGAAQERVDETPAVEAEQAADIAAAAAEEAPAAQPAADEAQEAAQVAEAASEVAEAASEVAEAAAEEAVQAAEVAEATAQGTEPPARARSTAHPAPAPAARRARPTPSRRRARREPGAPIPVVRAQAKYVRSSARKARLVCDHIRGKSVEEARAILALTPRAIARDWSKLLESAVANAEHNHELVGEDLYVKAVHADEGPTIKRFRPRAMGRATQIRKRTSHLTIFLSPKD